MKRHRPSTIFLAALVGIVLLAGATKPDTRSHLNAPGMTTEEAAAFEAFVKFWQDQDICWKSTVTRGVGVIPTECPNQEKNGGLCYYKCPAGFTGVAHICWQNCPPGFTNLAATCAKPEPYGRGGGYPWKFGDGFDNSGMMARCEADHGRGNCEMNGAIAYPKCRAGFHNVGCCICSPNCPGGMTDLGPTCGKRTHNRGVGKIPTCRSDQVMDAGLCYSECPIGTTGIGPVCWAGCNSMFPKDCGAACGKSSAACATAIINQVTTAGELALNMASFATGVGGASKLAFNSARNAARAAGKNILSKEARRAAIQVLKRELREKARKEGREMSEDALNMAAEALEVAKENGEFDWTKLDPTGIAEVVKAFDKPLCGR